VGDYRREEKGKMKKRKEGAIKGRRRELEKISLKIRFRF
jgi:hypothetical protein